MILVYLLYLNKPNLARGALAILNLLISVAWVNGQSIETQWRRAFWVDAGGGPGKNGLAVDVNFNFEIKENWVMSIRSNGIDESDESDGQSCPDKINSNGVALAIGRLIKLKPAMFLFSAGPSVIDLHHNPCTQTLTDQYHQVALGLDISAKAFLTTRFFGIAAGPFLNVNNLRSYYGMTFGLAVGRFRWREETP